MSPTHEDLAAQFADLRGLAGGPGRATRSVVLGGVRVSFASTDHALLDAVCRPMRHLVADSGPAQLRVDLLDARATLARTPPRWAWTVSRYADDRFEFTSLAWCGALLARDRVGDQVVWVLDASDPSRLARPEISRVLLEPLLAERGLVSVHGGTLGDGERGVLLSARGGSGKSSLVAHGVRRGLRTVGDDFLYLSPDGALWSAYATVKLAPASPAAHLIDPAVPVVDGKRMGWLPDLAEPAMARCQRVDTIVVPTVGDRVSIAPIPVTAALSALLPSSLQLSSDKPTAARELAMLVERCDCYRLTVANDPDAELAALASVAPHVDWGRAVAEGSGAGCGS